MAKFEVKRYKRASGEIKFEITFSDQEKAESYIKKILEKEEKEGKFILQTDDGCLIDDRIDEYRIANCREDMDDGEVDILFYRHKSNIMDTLDSEALKGLSEMKIAWEKVRDAIISLQETYTKNEKTCPQIWNNIMSEDLDGTYPSDIWQCENLEDIGVAITNLQNGINFLNAD